MQLIQHGTLSAGTYLEIGVDQGTTFSVVRVARKIGVDPIAPRPNLEAELKRPNAQYFATTGDGFSSVMPQSNCHWESMSSLSMPYTPTTRPIAAFATRSKSCVPAA